jgi:competence ComEA-like helix-hairpin-helix protein
VETTLLCDTSIDCYIAEQNGIAARERLYSYKIRAERRGRLRVSLYDMRMRFINIGHPSHTLRLLFSMLALGLFATAVASVVSSAQEPEDAPAAAFKRVCSSCHDSDRILATRRTRTQWEEIIEKMIDRGAEGTSEDFTTAEVYLLRVSGRVNVNRAQAQDIVAVLSVVRKDADAIVEYRKTNGEFKDFDAVCKVPGIDLEKLKQGRDAIAF